MKIPEKSRRNREPRNWPLVTNPAATASRPQNGVSNTPRIDGAGGGPVPSPVENHDSVVLTTDRRRSGVLREMAGHLVPAAHADERRLLHPADLLRLPAAGV